MRGVFGSISSQVVLAEETDGGQRVSVEEGEHKVSIVIGTGCAARV